MRGAPEVILLALLAVAMSTAGVWILLRNRRDPYEKERKRRELVNRSGRMGEAFISEVRDDVVYYTYEIRGVAYAASQDVSRLKDALPEHFGNLVGHVGLKYLPQNPANSIVVCEHWSGLRQFAPGSGDSSQVEEKR